VSNLPYHASAILLQIGAGDTRAACSWIMDHDGLRFDPGDETVRRLAASNTGGIRGEAGPDLVHSVDGTADDMLVMAAAIIVVAGLVMYVGRIGDIRFQTFDLDLHDGLAAWQPFHLRPAADVIVERRAGRVRVEITACDLGACCGRCRHRDSQGDEYYDSQHHYLPFVRFHNG